MRKRVLSVFSVLALLGAGCLGGTPSTSQTPPPQRADATSDGGAMVIETKSAVNVEDQPVGSDAVIAVVQLEKPGYVVIHADTNGQPGAIIGQTGLLVDRNYQNVLVRVNIENGKTYWAMLHIDNGNGTFAANEDPPARDSQNNVVMMSFAGSPEAGKMTEEEKAAEEQARAAMPKLHGVSIEDFVYSDNVLTVKRGDTIIFSNRDSVAHTATADNGAFDTGLLAQGESKEIDTSTLAPGTYPYHCTPHPNMKATVVVE